MPETESHSTAIKLGEAVSYQSNSIVSRSLYKHPKGRLTLFAFDAGQSLSEHVSPYAAWVQVVEGELECMIDKKPHRLTEGMIIHFPANVPHAVNAIQASKMLLMLFPAD